MKRVFNGRMKTTNQIKELLNQKEISIDAALALMLTAQMEIMERLAILEARQDEIEETHDRYPSVLWLWSNRRRELIIVAVTIALIYTVIFSPWNISDMRYWVLDALGLQPDLGLTPPPYLGE